MNAADYASLNSVADEYRHRGIRIDSYNGDCGDHLGDALTLATGASLFVFLDPCGAVLPMDSIKGLLQKRGSTAWSALGSAGATPGWAGAARGPASGQGSWPGAGSTRPLPRPAPQQLLPPPRHWPRQIFVTGAANEGAARLVATLVVGLSHGWWRRKHSRHHANPNKVGADKDVRPGVLLVTPGDVARAGA